MLTRFLDRLPIKSTVRDTLFVRAFGLVKVPLIFFLSPQVVSLTDSECVVKIPLSRRAKNHLGSMYFGALCVGADLAGGLHAMRLIEKSGAKIALIFKDFHAEFLKRPEGDVSFSCDQGEQIRDLVRLVSESTERHNLSLRIKASVQDEPVAWFDLTLSMKKKG